MLLLQNFTTARKSGKSLSTNWKAFVRNSLDYKTSDSDQSTSTQIRLHVIGFYHYCSTFSLKSSTGKRHEPRKTCAAHNQNEGILVDDLHISCGLSGFYIDI